MAKKRRNRNGIYWPTRKLENRLEAVMDRLAVGDTERAAETCCQILRHVRPDSCQEYMALRISGMAFLLNLEYESAYAVLTKALLTDEGDAELWMQRAMACQLTIRLGQSLLDLENAVKLADDSETLKEARKRLRETRKVVREELAAHGDGFTLEDLIELEAIFREGMEFIAAGDFARAEKAFREVIARDPDGVPQTWGNLGLCLIQQRRFDEAEVALRRSLQICPDYEFALANLEVLPEARLSEKAPNVLVEGWFGAPRFMHPERRIWLRGGRTGRAVCTRRPPKTGFPPRRCRDIPLNDAFHNSS